jgi:hypothetical protein
MHPMKKLSISLIGGLAGAVALNIVHQAAKQVLPKTPQVDLIGEEVLSKGLLKAGIEPPEGQRLFASTMAADIMSNAAYYALIGMGKKKNLLYYGAAFGLIAGIGALALTKPMGLDDRPVNRSLATKVMTVGWYTIGGLVTAAVIKAIRK